MAAWVAGKVIPPRSALDGPLPDPGSATGRSLRARLRCRSSWPSRAGCRTCHPGSHRRAQRSRPLHRAPQCSPRSGANWTACGPSAHGGGRARSQEVISEVAFLLVTDQVGFQYLPFFGHLRRIRDANVISAYFKWTAPRLKGSERITVEKHPSEANEAAASSFARRAAVAEGGPTSCEACRRRSECSPQQRRRGARSRPAGAACRVRQ